MKILLFLSKNYSFEILRPIQEQARQGGDQVMWFVYGNKVDTSKFADSEQATSNIKDAISFNPNVVITPSNIVPKFIPGVKVQIFHGFEWKKKGHFKIRDCFDLYCTQGPFFTERFEQLANKHRFFDVVETGWPKLDPLFDATPLEITSHGKPVILYAPTFSPSYTSVPDLFNEIVKLSEQGNYHWLIKFHPKMAKEWVNKFQGAQHEHLQVLEQVEISNVLQCADLMVSDTSSIVTEFLLLNKPVITYKNAEPEDSYTDITEAAQLGSAITKQLNPSPEQQLKIQTYGARMHPYHDGESSKRILEAVRQLLINGKTNNKPLPNNIFRNIKMRKKLKYWK